MGSVSPLDWSAFIIEAFCLISLHFQSLKWGQRCMILLYILKITILGIVSNTAASSSMFYNFQVANHLLSSFIAMMNL